MLPEKLLRTTHVVRGESRLVDIVAPDGGPAGWL
jgi:hypothetical protein